MRIILRCAELVQFDKVLYIRTASSHSVVKFCHTCDEFGPLIHIHQMINQRFVKAKSLHV